MLKIRVTGMYRIQLLSCEFWYRSLLNRLLKPFFQPNEKSRPNGQLDQSVSLKGSLD